MKIFLRIFSAFVHLACFVAFLYLQEKTASGTVLGASSIYENKATIKNNNQIETITAFEQKETTEYETIPFTTTYVDDDDEEYGTEKTVEEGVNGSRELTYKITFWEDEIINRQLVDTKTIQPKDEKIAKGTKIVWREYMTSDIGGVKYWYKFRVWATKYDANCIGCTGRTYSGTEVKKGVCATDPKVIPLGTNFYVEGYGLCRAEDIGGAIKGNIIDLGYEDVTKGEWRTGYTDVYLLTR